MNFCIISPTEGLEQYATRSRHHMVLAQQFVRDKVYADFYRARRGTGDFIFLDNGVYEGDYNPQDFLEAIRRLEPDVAVLPDVICKGPDSCKRSLKFYEQIHSSFPNMEWMFIPQGKNVLEWRRSMLFFINNIVLNKLWLGLTRFLTTDASNDPLIRVKLAKDVKDRWPALRIHCMGMADGSLEELELLRQQKLIESIDSSAPVWRGWKGIDIRARGLWRNLGCDVNFSAKLSEAKTSVIESNLEEVLERCQHVLPNRSGA